MFLNQALVLLTVGIFGAQSVALPGSDIVTLNNLARRAPDPCHTGDVAVGTSQMSESFPTPFGGGDFREGGMFATIFTHNCKSAIASRDDDRVCADGYNRMQDHSWNVKCTNGSPSRVEADGNRPWTYCYTPNPASQCSVGAGGPAATFINIVMCCGR
ncbi:hypothetical protein B0T14DRAFT_496943 [Immersiella caudata]|uniref:Uncharacterized protein n=1 Tax=Immersiella caudata TaxID=314043 RepID=A0AA40C0E3_9PEZI|nr:hypothetical protein B0T14DRAFT_496943 [Immersiella caudata]